VPGGLGRATSENGGPASLLRRRGAGEIVFEASGDGWRSLKDYVGALKENQTAIYYLAGDDITRLANSPHLEGDGARTRVIR
jgi:HSP90 family molecular chaperone